MSEAFRFRLNRDLKKKIEEDVKQGNFPSMNAWFSDAATHFLDCKKAHQVTSFRFIITRFKGKCIKCDETVPVGTGAYYARGTGILCLDCSVFKGMADKAIIAKYMKMKEFKEMARIFKAEVDRYAERLDVYAAADHIDKMKKATEETIAINFKYLKEAVGTPEDRRVFEDFIRLKQKELEVLHDLEEFLRRKLKRKLKKTAHVI